MRRSIVTAVVAIFAVFGASFNVWCAPNRPPVAGIAVTTASAAGTVEGDSLEDQVASLTQMVGTLIQLNLNQQKVYQANQDRLEKKIDDLRQQVLTWQARYQATVKGTTPDAAPTSRVVAKRGLALASGNTATKVVVRKKRGGKTTSTSTRVVRRPGKFPAAKVIDMTPPKEAHGVLPVLPSPAEFQDDVMPQLPQPADTESGNRGGKGDPGEPDLAAMGLDEVESGNRMIRIAASKSTRRSHVTSRNVHTLAPTAPVKTWPRDFVRQLDGRTIGLGGATGQVKFRKWFGTDEAIKATVQVMALEALDKELARRGITKNRPATPPVRPNALGVLLSIGLGVVAFLITLRAVNSPGRDKQTEHEDDVSEYTPDKMAYTVQGWVHRVDARLDRVVGANIGLVAGGIATILSLWLYFR